MIAIFPGNGTAAILHHSRCERFSRGGNDATVDACLCVGPRAVVERMIHRSRKIYLGVSRGMCQLVDEQSAWASASAPAFVPDRVGLLDSRKLEFLACRRNCGGVR